MSDIPPACIDLGNGMVVDTAKMDTVLKLTAGQSWNIYTLAGYLKSLGWTDAILYARAYDHWHRI